MGTAVPLLPQMPSWWETHDGAIVSKAVTHAKKQTRMFQTKWCLSTERVYLALQMKINNKMNYTGMFYSRGRQTEAYWNGQKPAEHPVAFPWKQNFIKIPPRPLCVYARGCSHATTAGGAKEEDCKAENLDHLASPYQKVPSRQSLPSSDLTPGKSLRESLQEPGWSSQKLSLDMITDRKTLLHLQVPLPKSSDPERENL